MKLASLRDGTPDGRLVVVSRDVTLCSDARHVAPSLRAALADWETVAPALELISRGIETGGQPVERFHERGTLSPLADGSTAPRGALPAGDATPGVSVVAGADGATILVLLHCALGEGRAFSPVAVTPDEIEGIWDGEMVRAPLTVTRGETAATVEAASVPDASGSPRTVAACPPVTGVGPGETLRVEMRDGAGHSVFGAIELTASA